MSSPASLPPFTLQHSVHRYHDQKTDAWLWRAYVIWAGGRTDRHFYDGTYGDAKEAKIMAEAWCAAMVALAETLTPSDLRSAAFRQQRVGLNAHFDALRPRCIFLRVHIADRAGIPDTIRFLVTDREPQTMRHESAVSFASRPFGEALELTRERVAVAVEGMFGTTVAERFMAQYGVAFGLRRFDQEKGVLIRERLDKYTS